MYKILNILRIILGGGFLYMWFGSNVGLGGGYIIAIAFWVVFLASSIIEIILFLRNKEDFFTVWFIPLEILSLVMSFVLSSNWFFLGVPFLTTIHGVIGFVGDFLKKKTE